MTRPTAEELREAHGAACPHPDQSIACPWCALRHALDLLAEADQWRTAVEDAAVVDWTYNASHTPREAVNALLAWQSKIALDPLVSQEAAELHSQLAEARADHARVREQRTRAEAAEAKLAEVREKASRLASHAISQGARQAGMEMLAILDAPATQREGDKHNCEKWRWEGEGCAVCKYTLACNARTPPTPESDKEAAGRVADAIRTLPPPPAPPVTREELVEAVLAWRRFWDIEMPPVGTYHRLKELADRLRAERNGK